MEQGALESQASTTLNRDADLEERLSQLVYDNESLKIEVGRLQGILERSGALKAHELQSENETQRHTIEHLTTQLTEKEQQLSELRSANTRFANIDATVQNFLTQLQAQQDEVTQLKRTLEEKESELQAVRANANAANESHKSVTALEETNAKLQQDLSAAQRNARDVTQKLNEAMTRQQDDNLAAQKVREQLASLQVAHSALHAQLQAKQAELDKALQEVQTNKMQRVTTPAGDTRGHSNNNEEEEVFDQAALTPRMKAYVQRCIAQATAGVEQRLREQTDLNASLLAFKAMVQNEKEINASRENETSGKTVTVASPAPVNAECVQLRNKQQEAYQEMQRRVSQVLAADKLSKRDIQLLLQEMLDYQEKADEDMRTRLLIKDIQCEELNKLQEEKIKRLETENGSLLKQLHDAMQARNEAQPSRTATPRQQQQQRLGHTTVVVPVLPDRQRSISPGTQTCSITSSPARGMSGSESASAGVTPLYARQPSMPTTLYSNNYNNSSSNSVSGAGGTMSPRWAAVMSGPAMGVPVLSNGRQGNGQYANGVGEQQQQQRSNAAAMTMPAAAAAPLSSGHYYHKPNANMQAASSQSTMISAHGTSEMNAAPGRGMIMCPACAYWQLNDNQTCCCCGRILPRH